MTLKKFLLFISLFYFQFIFSQDIEFNVFSIPDSLTQNANSVVRFDETNIELVSSKKMTITYKKAITILNKFGDGSSRLRINYDSSNKIKSLKAYVYNSFGVEIKDLKKKDFKDRSVADGFSLFNDGRYLYYNHVPIAYPYTIYYEYEIESSNTAFIPPWFLFDAYNQSIVHSNFTINFPDDIKIQKVEKNFDNFKIVSIKNLNSINYQVNGIKAVSYEQLSPSFYDIFPWVRMATNKFRLEGVDGTADNWQEFGKWMYDHLISSRMALPESTKLIVSQLVEGVDDPIERAKIIYKYVQNKTRYISVQVGIGGWMPMLASDVDRLNYGDCKALTNYTKSLMDAANVESYYTAVNADDPKLNMEKDVISVQGNHVILNLPTDTGDIWLECTSQIDPFGYQGTFTDDRDVLVITPDGGKIKHTGIYEDNNSYQKTLANYKLSSNGNLEGNVKISTSGIQYRKHFHLEKKPERDINMHYKSDYWPYINNLTIDSYTFSNNKDSIIFNEELKIKATDYSTFSGDRMLFILNAFNRVSSIPKRYRNRKLPLEIVRGFIDSDDFEIVLPDDFTIEAIPDNIKIENKFGSYQFSVEKLSDTKLKYARTFFLKKGIYPPSDYKSYRNFRKQIVKLDKTKIVLIKK